MRSFFILLLCVWLYSNQESRANNLPDSLNSLSTLAERLKNEANYDSALVVYRKMLDSNPSYSVYNSMAECWLRKGDIPAANLVLNKLLKEKDTFNPSPLEYAYTLHWLGVASFYQGKQEEALDYYEQSLRIRKKHLPALHIDLGQTYNNLALVWNAKHKYGRSLQYFEKALPVFVSNFGENHTRTSSVYANMSLTYYSQEEYDKSIVAAQKAVNIQKALGNTESVLLATMYYFLSNGYIGKQDTVTAMRLQNISLDMRLKLLGDIHPDVAQSYHGIGRVYEVSGNYAKAVIFETKAREIYKELYGIDSRQLLESQETIEKYKKNLFVGSLKQFAD